MSEVKTVTDSIGSGLLKALVAELTLLSPRFTHQNEEMQQEIIDRLRLQVQDQLTEAVRQIAAKSYVSAPGTIMKIAFKDEMQAVVKVNRTNKAVHDIVDSVGGPCMIVLCDLDQYIGGMESAVKPTPRQQDWTPDGD